MPGLLLLAAGEHVGAVGSHGGCRAAGRLSLEEPSLEFGDLLVPLRQPAHSLSRSDCGALRRSLALAVSA